MIKHGIVVVAYMMVSGCFVEHQLDADNSQEAAPAPSEFTLCAECFCGDWSYAPVGTPCGIDGEGRCRQGRCNYKCSYDGSCALYHTYNWEAAAGCVSPCQEGMTCNWIHPIFGVCASAAE